MEVKIIQSKFTNTLQKDLLPLLFCILAFSLPPEKMVNGMAIFTAIELLHK